MRNKAHSGNGKYWHGSKSVLEPGARFIRRGVSLACAGKHKEALTYFEMAINASPNETFAYLHKALSLHHLGRTDEAEQCFRRGMDLDFVDLMSWRKFKMAFMPRMPREIISWMDGPPGRIQDKGTSDCLTRHEKWPGDPVLEPETAELHNRGTLEMQYFLNGNEHFELMLALERCVPDNHTGALKKEVTNYKNSIQSRMAEIRDNLPPMHKIISPRYGQWARMKLAVLYDSFEMWGESAALLDRVIRETECPDAMCLKGTIMQDNYMSAEKLGTTLECYGTEHNKPERKMSGCEPLYDAIQCYDNAIICAPNLCSAHYNKARAYHELDEIPHAMMCLDLAMRLLLNPRYDAASILREYDIKKRPGIGVVPSGDATPKFPGGWPGSRDVELDLDCMLYESLEIFDLSIALHPKMSHISSRHKAQALYFMSRYEEAIPCYDAYLDVERTDVRNELLKKADALEKIELYDQAMVCCNDVLRIEPESVRALIKKSALYRNQEEFEKALSCVDIKFELTADEQQSVLFEKAILYFMTGKPEESMSCINEVLKKDPKNSDMLFNKASILYSYYDISRDESKLREAIACYDVIINSDNASADASYNRGMALMELGRPEEAAQSFQNATIIKPKMAEAFDSWGNALNEIGKHEQAIECYDRAISIKPDYAVALYNKANSLYHLDRITESAECLDEAMRMGADLRDANDIREMLRRRLDFNDSIHKK